MNDLHEDVFVDSFVDEIKNARDNTKLDRLLGQFQKLFRDQRLTKEETAKILAAGKAKRADLSTAEERRNNVAYSRAHTKIQSHGVAPRPNLLQLPDDERELYQNIQKVDLRSHDPLGQLERWELVYAEKERSEAGKKLLMDLFEQRGRELSAVWAEVKGAK